MKLLLSMVLFGASLFANEQFDKILPTFEKYVEEERQNWNVPGLAIGITQGDRVILLKGYGQRGIKDTRAVDENTLFQIGSISKSFATALTALAVDRKWVDWNDKVVEHLPAFRLYDPWVAAQFEIVDLLCQRSGLPSYAGDSQSFLGYSAADMIKNLVFVKPISSFRSQFAYQNIFFVVATELLKAKTGRSFEDLLHEELFKPLEMQASSSSLEDYLKAENRAEWIMRVDGKNRSFTHNPPLLDINWTYVLGAAGGVNSTISDMTKWIIFQANDGLFKGKQLISKKNMQELHRPFTFVNNQEGTNSYYALGWIYREYSPYPIIWHNGATLGAYNMAAFVPQDQLGIVILSNVRETQLALALAFQFFDLYYGKKGSDWSKKMLADVTDKEKKVQQEAPPPPNPQPPLPLEMYTGTYHNQVYGDVQISKKDDGLTLQIGKEKALLPLKHWSHDTFTLDWPIVVFEPGSKVFFFSEGNQPINRMNIQLQSEEGSGLYERVIQ